MAVTKSIFATLSTLAISGCSGNLPGLNEGSIRSSYEQTTVKAPVQGKLYSKKPKSMIDKDGAFQIDLISGYICDFREAGGVVNQLAGSNKNDQGCQSAGSSSLSGVSTRGEVAITPVLTS